MLLLLALGIGTLAAGGTWLLLRERTFDAVLGDPMFPPKRRASARPPQEIQVLRAAGGEDPDADQLLATARRAARIRTVVKRSDDAPGLSPGVDARIDGRTVRFDVYLAPRP
jgi:16S rRNA (guanine1516-N2)-methyltransferase